MKQKNITEKDGEKVLRVSISTIVYSILILLVAIVAVGSILAYGTNTKVGGKISAGISKIIPFPVAIVSWDHVVYLDDLESNLASVLQFYKTQNFSNEGLRVDFSTPVGQKRLEIKKREILDKMVEDQIIEQLAKKQGITISDSEVEKAVNTKLNEFGTEKDVKADLLKSYGWDMDDFKKKVVLPSMYTDALSKYVLAQNVEDASAKQKIQAAQNDLKNGVDFVDVAKKYSEGSTASSGGELGWVNKDQVAPELASALFGETQLEKNSIIESSVGYHIVQIESKKKDGNADVLQLRQIFVAKNSFADWLTLQKKKFNVWVPVSEFVWNSQTGTVDFRDKQMQEFEQDERAKTQGDASLMF